MKLKGLKSYARAAYYIAESGPRKGIATPVQLRIEPGKVIEVTDELGEEILAKRPDVAERYEESAEPEAEPEPESETTEEPESSEE